MKTVVGLYDDLSDARDVVRSLMDAGIARDNISLVVRDQEGEYAEYLNEYNADIDQPADTALESAVTGGVLGGLAGLLLGLSAFAIPGIGPVVAAGPIVAGLAGAGIGAAAGGLLGALVEAGISEEEAGYYVEGVHRGSTLVTVRALDSQVDDVANIMNRFNPVDIQERAAEWGEVDWIESEVTDALRGNEYDEYREYDNYESAFRSHHHTNYAAGGYTYDVYAPAYRMGYELARNPSYRNRRWTDLEPEARRRWETEQEGAWDQFKDAVRHAWLEVKETFTGEEEYDDTYEPTFRRHYQAQYSTTGHGYGRYRPAYRFGSELAADQRYQGWPWDRVEADARTRWEAEHHQHGTWAEFRDAVSHGWTSARTATTRERHNGESLQTLFADQLRDLHSAETQLVEALPKMAEAAFSSELKQAFQRHLEQTQNHLRRLEQILQQLGESSSAKECKAMKGLIEEGEQQIEMYDVPSVRDAALIAAAQRVEHYEIAAYGSALTYAEELDLDDAADLLQETLDEESKTNEKLTDLAEGGLLQMGINEQARMKDA